MTPREYGALKRVWESSHQHLNLRFAELQATLHNAWFRSKEHHPAAYAIEEFLPGAQKKQPTLEEQKQNAVAKKFQMAMMMRAAGVQFRPLSERPANGG